MSHTHDSPSPPAGLPARSSDPAGPSGPHDVGGLPGGPVDRHEHLLNFWEWRVDAMVRLLFQAGLLKDFAELRRAVEDMGPDVYEKLSYYERWAGAIETLMVEKGVLTAEEIEARIAEIQARQGAAS